MTPRFLPLALFLLVAVTPASPLGAQDRALYDNLELIEARPLFPASQTEWIPFLIAIANHEDRARTVEVQVVVTVSGREFPVTWSVDLSPGATKRQVIPCYRGRSGRRSLYGRVRLLENGRRLTPELGRNLDFDLASSRRNQGQVVCKILMVRPDRRTSTAPAEDFWRREMRTARVEDVDFERIVPSELPLAPEAYEAADRVVLLGVGPEELSPGQVRALERAVRSGTRVWIVPGRAGEGYGWTGGGEANPAPRSHHVAGEAHTAFIGDLGEGEVLSTVRDRQGNEIPAVIRYPDGLGEWRRCTFHEFVTGLDLRESAVGKMIPDLHPMAQQPDWQWRGAGPGRWHRPLDELLRQEVPLEAIFVILVAYLLIIGPGLFWLLKRWGRLILLLWLQPVVVALFLAAIYLLGWIHFGAFSREFETLVIQHPGTGTWGHGLSVLTHYSPAEGTEDLVSGDGTLPVLLSSTREGPGTAWAIDGTGNRLRDFHFATWSYTHFITGGPLEVGPGPRVRFVVDDSRLEIENRLTFRLKDPVFQGVRYPGVIEPGAFEEFPIGPQGAGNGVSVRRDGFWNRVLRGISERVEDKTGNKNHVLLEFDPTELKSAPFSVGGEKESRRGVLILPVSPVR